MNNYARQSDTLQIRGGVVYRRWKSADELRTVYQILLHVKYQSSLIKEAYRGLTGGRFGVRRTCTEVARRACWTFRKRNIESAMRRCNACSENHRGAMFRQGALQQMLVGER